VSRFQTLLLVIAGLNAAASVGQLARVVVRGRRFDAERRRARCRGAAMKGRIAVAELLKHRLSGQPECVIGVGFRSPALAVLCRRHVTGEALEGLGSRRCDEAAVLLIGGRDQGECLSGWCVVCRGLVVPAGGVERELVLAGGTK
jgi:hypothetical protein